MDVLNGCIKEFMVIKNIADNCLIIHANLLLRLSNSTSSTRVYCPVSKSLPMSSPTGAFGMVCLTLTRPIAQS